MAGEPPLLGGDRQAFARMIVQVWTEILRNEERRRPSPRATERYRGMRAAWTDLVTAHRASGLPRGDVPADHVARTLIAVARGFIGQRALFGDVVMDVREDGLRSPLSISVDPVG
ncbi:hypothetical protein [Streptomyces sp. Qhu_M48]|uniref:hypothetical protein n=1 Tax=Streptomyces sp. Qhu_M48 TaxID=3435889 RepID=UPI003F4FF3F4